MEGPRGIRSAKRLPWMTGIDLLTRLRRDGVGLPVVFFTSHDLKAHESLAFDKGAFDFVFKSRGVEILAKRLRRVAKAGRVEALFSLTAPLVLGKLVLGEFKIVHLLASNAGRYVANRTIYDRLHYQGFVGGRGSAGYRANVRSAIKRIRNKFRDCDPEFQEIRNYTAFGYCWGKPDGTG
jgi:two-component system response regulator ChvI